MVRIWVGILILLSAQRAFAEPYGIYHFRIPVVAPLNLDFSGFYESNPMTVSRIATLAQSAPNYEAFLSSLQSEAPHLFENYVLLHGTGSLQHATPSKPRVILFGDGLLIAFAEDPATTSRKVEVIAFDPTSAAFSFHEARFANANTAGQVDNAPRSCATCHGSPGRPLWDPYDFWPTAYGSAISRFRSSEERAAYKAIFTLQAQTGIYRYLSDHSRTKFDELALPSIETFTVYLANMNFVRAAERLKAHKSKIGALEYSIFATLRRCEDRDISDQGYAFKDFFPAETWNSASKSYEEILAETKSARIAFKAKLERRYAKQFPNNHTVYSMNHDRLGKEANVAAQLRFVLENIGLSMEFVPTSSGDNKWFMSTPSNFALDFSTALVRFDRDAMMAAGADTMEWASVSCEKARALSLQNLAGFKFPQTPPAPLTADVTPAPIGICIRCHGDNGNPNSTTPKIPFDDTMALKSLFISKPTLRDSIKARIHARDATRMPPSAGLSLDELKSFDDFVEGL